MITYQLHSRDVDRTSQTIAIQLRGGLPAAEVDQRVALANRAGDIGARTLAFYLVDLADRGAHQELGFHSVVQYAETRYHIQPSTTREYLAVGRALDELPGIDEAFCTERLLWSQVRQLVRVATPQTESEWVTWAQGRTARQIAAEVRRRSKGERPTDPARRRIHTTTFKVEAKLNAVQLQIWNNARAKLQAETDRPVSDTELMLEMARQLLATRPDGSVPGRTPVNDSHFRVVVHHNRENGRTTVETEDGSVELDCQTSQSVLREAGCGELADTLDDEDDNSGAPVGDEARDEPTPPEMRARILARDGFRCRCCESKKNLTVHHKKWRRYGGRTHPENLLTQCEDCHSLIHDRLLVVRGKVPLGLRFTDSSGRGLDDLGEPMGLVIKKLSDNGDARALPTIGHTHAAFPAPMRFQDLPSEVDGAWWARHCHLLSFNDRQGTLEFTPGVPLEVVPERANNARALSTDGNARASRPAKLADLVGQERVVGTLRVAVTAARLLGEPLPHILLVGPPGLGKTSLSRAVASEMGAEFHGMSAPVVKEPGILLRLLTSLAGSDVLFLDELHRLPARVAEVLYEAMEDGCLSLPVSSGMMQRTLHVRLGPFTLIGATSEEELLPPPLRSRFEIREHLEFYRPDALAELLGRRATRDGLEIDSDAARLLAGVSRDTPREALALLRSVREEVAIGQSATIDTATVQVVLERLGIDQEGLRPHERNYLEILREARQALGLSTLAARLGESRRTVQRVYEPYLIRRGLVVLTRHGRVITGGG